MAEKCNTRNLVGWQLRPLLGRAPTPTKFWVSTFHEKADPCQEFLLFSTINVRQSVWRGSLQSPKTDNAVRELDVHPSLAALLKASVGNRTSGFLFQSESGRPLTQRNALRDGLGKIRRDMKLERGKALHAFRRFRTMHLRKNRVPWDLQKLWLGHANKDVTDRYAEQLKEDVEWRKEKAERAGLGFKLPSVETSVGLLGLPKQQKSKLKN